MIRKVFTKLLGLFVLLLVFHTVVMELVFSRMVHARAGETLHLLGREALLSGLIALAVALPVAAWVAAAISSRLERVIAFATDAVISTVPQSLGVYPHINDGLDLDFGSELEVEAVVDMRVHA